VALVNLELATVKNPLEQGPPGPIKIIYSEVMPVLEQVSLCDGKRMMQSKF